MRTMYVLEESDVLLQYINASAIQKPKTLLSASLSASNTLQSAGLGSEQ